jgi:hypothetical protein
MRRINARKKNYIVYLEHLIDDVQHRRASVGVVTPRVAAFALLGMINWIYQWYRPEGSITEEALIKQYTAIFFSGIFARG